MEIEIERSFLGDSETYKSSAEKGQTLTVNVSAYQVILLSSSKKDYF